MVDSRSRVSAPGDSRSTRASSRARCEGISLSPASGRPIINPTQDIVLGLYYATREKKFARGCYREGAFAEYLVIPAFNAFRIPDDISDDLAAIFDPFGNATHTALAFNLVGDALRDLLDPTQRGRD